MAIGSRFPGAWGMGKAVSYRRGTICHTGTSYWGGIKAVPKMQHSRISRVQRTRKEGGKPAEISPEIPGKSLNWPLKPS